MHLPEDLEARVRPLPSVQQQAVELDYRNSGEDLERPADKAKDRVEHVENV